MLATYIQKTDLGDYSRWRECVCVCVCVCEREKQGGKERVGDEAGKAELDSSRLYFSSVQSLSQV